MSCMEHRCTACGWVEFNNARGPLLCPACGNDVIQSTFDEEEREDPDGRDDFGDEEDDDFDEEDED